MSPIYTLPSTGGSSYSSGNLRDDIEAALLGTAEPTVPGDREEDKAWAFKRSVPTVVLYDEQGLRLYDKITAEAPEYYLFPDELNLLRNHGPEIARSMGFPGRRPLTPEELENEQESQEERKQLEKELEIERAPEKNWKPARWGDAAVGKWNNGVNGEQGLGGGFERGYDVVELGAGALRKTAHLLTALAGAVPDNASGKPPITFHPLDLSYPELDRVLGEMDQGFGDKLTGKVECIGLHGDYNAGLDFIKEGKLAGLRAGLEGGKNGSPDSLGPVTPVLDNQDLPASPTETNLVTPPGIDISPLPTAVSDVSPVSPIGEEIGTTCSQWPTPKATPIVASQAAIEATEPTQPARPLHIVFLGSSLGNFEREGAAPFLRSLPLGKGDTLLLGLDGRPAPGEEGRKKVEVAYNDPAGHTRAFEEYGWEIVRRELELEGDPGVEFVGRYNEVLGRHEAYFKSKAKQTISLPGCGKEVQLEEGELLNIEWSYKYSLGEALSLFKGADLKVINSWKAPDSEYRLWLLERPVVRFAQSFTEMANITPLATFKGHELTPPDESVTRGVIGIPSWDDWTATWKLWDHITLEMIPKEMLHTKPIDLRHICLFYLGHIPTFLDIYLTRLTNGKHTHPEFFKDIFERGIDPDVDDPTKIHSHSEVPVEECDWPSLDEILAFRDRVRMRVRDIYNQLNNGSLGLNRRAARIIFMGYEHEAMHAETLLYMLIQSASTRAPTCAARPQWDLLAKRWASETEPNEVIEMKETMVILGHDDSEDEDSSAGDIEQWKQHEFGWDNESPQVRLPVKAFKIDALPVSNAEYLEFAKATKLELTKDSAPASWVVENGEWRIRTLYGPVNFDVAGQWPLQASKNELEAFAKWKGGRLPTELELNALYQHEDGVRPASVRANIGFKNWHPVPAEKTKVDNAGIKLRGHNGGVWEWTTTPFDGLEGFVPGRLYPGYSTDFYDDKHFVVLGGSYATIPNMAGRRSFRNFYQGNYRFSFVGGRVAYDV